MGVVYSTEHGRMCPQCEQPVASCACKDDACAQAQQAAFDKLYAEHDSALGQTADVANAHVERGSACLKAL